MDILNKLGLTNTESKVYITIGKLGKTTIGEVIKESGVQSSHIYPAINSLISKGLLSNSFLKKRRLFQLTTKSALKELLDSKREEIKIMEKELDQKIPSLFSNLRNDNNSLDITVYEGIAGIKAAIENVLNRLNKGGNYYVLGAPAIINNRLNGFFIDFHKRRIAHRINYKIIYNMDAKEFAKQRLMQELTEVRVQNLNNSVEIAIYQDVVQFVFLDKKYKLIEVINDSLAKTMLSYFNIVWYQSTRLRNSK